MQDDAGMGASPGDDDGPTGPLREALRRARVEAAEHSDVVIDLRQAEIVRLEILRDALASVFADVPSQIDLFDVGLVPGDRPRLFVDMVAFIEMGRDRRLYRFVRDGRHGRSVVAESDQVQPIVDAVTAYVARRLVERERLLADDDRIATPVRTVSAAAEADAEAQAEADVAQPAAAAAPAAPSPHPARVQAPGMAAAEAARPKARKWVRALAIVAAFGLGGGVGAAVVIAFMVAAAKGLLPGIG